jgi:peptide/nickel transport system permease protein
MTAAALTTVPARRGFAQRFLRNRVALAGLAVLVAVMLVALSAGILFPGDPFQSVAKPFERPFGEHLLGTDVLGRSVAGGIAHGARASLVIGIVATLAAVLIGTALGAFSGYFGGRVDYALMRVTEFFQTIPTFLFAIVLVAILSPSMANLIIAIALVSWPPIARLVRGEFLAMRAREFVQACISVGMSDPRIMFGQILPNCLSPIIVTGSLMVATAILTESALAFLGLGDPNVMSWGFMIGAGRTHLRTAWWLTAIPGCAILITVLAINLVGEALNDVLNPRLRQE